MTTESITIGPRIVKGRVHCGSCGRYAPGTTFVSTAEGHRFVCNVQCGIDFIVKRQEAKDDNRE